MIVTGLTADRMRQIEAAGIIDGDVDANGNLILTTYGGLQINAGKVKGDPGEKGDPGDDVDAKAYSDAGDITTLASAKTYTDNAVSSATRPVDGIATGVDLNTLVTNGKWVQRANANAAGGINYPIPYAGLLEVSSSVDLTFVWQRYTAYQAFAGVRYERTRYNGVWSGWQQLSAPGSLIRVGTNIRTTNTTNTSSEYNICTFTLPFPINGETYRVRAGANFTPDTAGGYTALRIKHATGASVGGTQIANIYADHRSAGRTVGATADAEFTYTGTTGASGYNVVAVGFPGATSSYCTANSTIPAYLYVDRVL